MFRCMSTLGRMAMKQWTPKQVTCPQTPKHPQKKFEKVLVANRSEVAIRISRACSEMGIKPLGIYSSEDRYSAHRGYMDQSFLVGKGCSPTAAYLNIPEIICVAQNNQVDAIHPGYGFLSEREDFARAVRAAGMEFIGPRPQVLRTLGDKTLARDAALHAGVPIVPGTTEPVTDVEGVKAFCSEFGFPIILKAAYGGGGRGMRLVVNEDQIEENFMRARSEALAAFGKDEMLIEKYIESPRHIEVQILGDKQGNVLHLYERDCSMQRRYQKVIQIAPAQDLCPIARDRMTEMSVKLGKSIGYSNAGTVEFLVDKENDFYFIEVNPRLQVEHTLTEEITGVDIVQTQIKIAQGMSLAELGLAQSTISTRGCAIQCHLRTEDPMRNFQPSTGRLDFFTAPAGLGIRLDSSSPYPGQYISPDYDSLLAKIITHSSTYSSSCEKMRRALQETTASGVVTNLPFLLNVFENQKFLSGKALATTFIDDHAELLVRQNFQHRCAGDKVLRFLAEVLVNGPGTKFLRTCKTPDIDPTIELDKETCERITKIKLYNVTADPKEKYLLHSSEHKGLRSVLKHCGADTFVDHVRKLKPVLLMDTTFRDAHQSLLATRMRTYDLKNVSPYVSHKFHNLYAIEMWGGATYHTCLKFLKECPWERLHELRELIPNIPFQMLLHGNSLVGYQNYSSDDVHTFCRLAVSGGVDIFRVFDPFNNVRNLMKGINVIHKEGGGSVLVEATVCYAGDVTDSSKKFSLQYYEDLADQLVKSGGINAICVKDMAALMKPSAARLLIRLLREKHPHILIHAHTHDTTGTGVASMLACVEAGADVIDVCADSMSGRTSQPAMGTIVACLDKTERACGFDLNDIATYSSYWTQVRNLYEPFEFTDLKSSCSDIFLYEIPGGQYTNLYFQSMSLGLDFEKVKKAYRDANFVLGDIIKVTPTSKIVGDLALFMARDDLSYQDVIKNAKKLTFPHSLIEYFQGSIGEPYQGLPNEMKEVLSTVRSHVPLKVPSSQDYEGVKLNGNADENAASLLNMVMFPEETKQFLKFRETYGRTDILPTRIFFYGPPIGEEFTIEFEQGNVAYIETLGVSSSLNKYGERSVFFLYNGQTRSVLVRDEKAAEHLQFRSKADESNVGEIGAPMPGNIVDVKVQSGQQVQKGDLLVVLSAMKTEVLIHAPTAGRVKEILVKAGSEVHEQDLLLTLDVNA